MRPDGERTGVTAPSIREDEVSEDVQTARVASETPNKDAKTDSGVLGPPEAVTYKPPRMFSNLGKLPGTWLALVIMLLAGASESIGLALFVPIIEMMNSQGAPPQIPIEWLDSAIRNAGISRSFPAMLFCVACLVVCAFWLSYLQAVILKRAQYQYVKDLRHRLFHALMTADWHHLSAQVQGDVINNLLMESQRYAQSLSFEVKAVALFILIAIYLAMGALLSPELLLIIFAMGLLIVLAVGPFLKRAKTFGEETHNGNRAFSFLLSEVFRGIKLIKVTGSAKKVENRFEDVNEELRRVFFESERNGEIINLLVQSLPVIGLTFVIGVAFLYFHVAASVILVFLVIISRLAPKLAQLQQLYNQYHIRSPTISALEIMIAEAEGLPDRPDQKGKTFEQFSKGIVFENVGYRFPGIEENALESISLEIRKSEMVALVGSSGAGKSTLVDMLVALREPTEGRIRVDDVALEEFDVRSWRQKIGYVTQEITLFNDTLRNNLTFVKTDVDDDVLWEALRTARLDTVVRDMPNGLGTILGENGIRLSGGQRQRLALARALVGKPEILLLDEATSALDSETEFALKNALTDIAKEMSILIVSHRLSTVQNADRIYVMDNGRIVEEGSFDDLMVAGGRFAQLNRLQSA